VDVAVIEVGMGGVWDATNVADADVAVIGPIALDHERWLGSSLAEIAAEKAGIVKANSVAVVAEQSDVAMEIIAATLPQARLVIREGEDLEVVDRAAAVGGQLLTLRTPSATYEGVYVPLLGAHQARNASMALAAVEALLSGGGELQSLAGDTVDAGFAAVTSPGRLEIVRTSPTIVVDAAHNPHGIGALAEAMDESFAFSTLVGVVGVLDDKDADGILAGLESLLDSVVVTRSSSPRAIDPDHLARIAVTHFGEDRVSTAPDVPSALDAAVQRAERDDDMGGGVLVVGSITLVADARVLLGVDKPPRHEARS
jgi:dihydrofolate synthase/folylpolyglutamate synthase